MGPALIAFDGSPSSRAALRTAARLLAGREAVVATVWLSVAAVAGAGTIAVPARVAREAVARHDSAAAERARELAEEGAELAREAGLEATAFTRVADPNLSGAVLRAADEIAASVIVIGSRGRSGVSAAVLGSTSATVLQHSERPVLLVRPEEKAPSGASGNVRPVVFASDGSDGASRAAEAAAELLAAGPAISLTVWESVASGVFRHELPESLKVARDVVDQLDSGTRQIAEEAARTGAQALESRGWRAEAMARRAYEGSPREATAIWQEVVRAADEHEAAASVLGTRGMSPLRTAFLGSVSHGVVHGSSRPVLVVPGGDDGA